jgi:hypothetical protein
MLCMRARARRSNATGMFCLPYFHIIGVSKCGTTDLFRRLLFHPHVAPTHNKGPHFWGARAWHASRRGSHAR